MSFGWLGTFRQGSWRAFRSFVLQERRDVDHRIKTIRAELARIGNVVVKYATTPDEGGREVVSEQRQTLMVSQGSSLEKLLQAYIAMGGNPFDISLFLTPDSTVVFDRDGVVEEKQAQPYGGVVHPKDGVYSTGVQYEGGYLTIRKYVPARTGGRQEVEDSRTGNLVSQARQWTNQSIQYKRNNLEAKIVKLCDLREQLLQELEDLALATGGTVGAIPSVDGDQYVGDYGVAQIVAAIDSVFYEVSQDGTADFSTENVEALAYYPHLLSDILPDEDNTAL